MFLSVLNSKGGVGKTTTAIYTGLALAARGLTVTVLDGDPQESALAWARYAAQAGDPLPFEVVAAPAPADLTALRPDEDEAVILDVNPSQRDMLLAAIKAADLVIVPTDASPLDLARVWPTLAKAEELGTLGAVLMTKVRTNTSALPATIKALEEAEAAVFDTLIPEREEIKQAMGTCPRRLQGYENVAAEIMEALK